jgi:hypothetical protein
LQSDGKIIIGGDFTSYNGTGRNRVARIVVREAVITEIKENSNAVNLIVYPNPASTSIIVIASEMKQSQLIISNVLGQVVSLPPFEGGRGMIDVVPFSKGVYFIQLITQNKIVTAQFIKE